MKFLILFEAVIRIPLNQIQLHILAWLLHVFNYALSHTERINQPFLFYYAVTLITLLQEFVTLRAPAFSRKLFSRSWIADKPLTKILINSNFHVIPLSKEGPMRHNWPIIITDAESIGVRCHAGLKYHFIVFSSIVLIIMGSFSSNIWYHWYIFFVYWMMSQLLQWTMLELEGRTDVKIFVEDYWTPIRGYVEYQGITNCWLFSLKNN